jgi:pilus assembly protein Flp/PilA
MRYLMWIKVLVQNLKSKDGVTAIEYGLIAALIAVAIIVAVTLVGTNLQLTFNTIAGHLGSSPH